MSLPPFGAALVTGASSGIGKATARALGAAGYLTVATARDPRRLGDLEAAGCRALGLDVTDEGSVTSAVHTIEETYGSVSVLVNNAGYGEMGPLEELPIDAFRRELETNLIGLLRLTQLVLPTMRQRGYGRIVNMSGMGGLMSLPGGGAYYASKYALEGLSDALRAEVAPFGIEVIVIEPGLVTSGFNATARESSALAQNGGPYDGLKQALKTRAFSSDVGRLEQTFGATPDQVAEVVVRAVSADHPKTRYPVTLMARVMPALRRLLPDRRSDAMARAMLGVQ